MRAQVIEQAMREVQKEQAQRRVALGLRAKGIPIRGEISEKFLKLPAESPVYVYRAHRKRWEGPFPFIQIDGETVVVQLSPGRRIFRKNVVKPVIWSNLKATPFYETSINLERFQANREHNVLASIEVNSSTEHAFIQYRMKELNGLIKNNTFKIVYKATVPKGIRICGCRFLLIR